MTERHYYKQLHRHDSEDGLIGDCWRTCIANLLGLKPQQVPHFMALHWGDGKDSEPARKAANEWLAQYNLQLMSIALTAGSSTGLSHLGASHYILEGMGIGGECAHAVIGYGAFEVFHNPACAKLALDPIPDPDGGPPFYWLTWLVPVNLAAMVQKT